MFKKLISSIQSAGDARECASSLGATACTVSKTAVQLLGNNTITLVTWDNELFDTSSLHDNATNNSRITVPFAGIWEISCTLSWAVAGAGQREFAFKVNGGADVWVSQVANGGTGEKTVHHGSYMVSLNANDYVEVRAWQNSGGNLNINAESYCSMKFIGRQ